MTIPFVLRKENIQLNILVREQLEDGTFSMMPEDPGLPIAILHGPNSVIKLRKQAYDIATILPSLGDCVVKLYQGGIQLTEPLRT
jgi:hypothetical protein